MKQLAVFFCITVIILISSCAKKNQMNEPQPGFLPDTNRFNIPTTYSFVNGYTTFYYPNSTIISSQGNYQNGNPSGYWKLYYSNGNLMREGNYSNGQLSGYWKFYYSTGVEEEEGNYQNNIKSGNWIYYYPSGIISSEGNYSNGVKQGQWTYYNTNGTVSSSVSY